ncbi:hypothetical protein OGAPHI_002172 [Ogataea philodendri]|uniref:Uncharacterized protein n=1 Tax=Ogataea philodendri TaxID=1378263 RepID=A0A9P8T6S4_9ASCO|nr:uncharacterized protein OGAPHI_002172 [Ogataea philodendri]KAH3668418.1 hypothetical protein OGAPHI_002172 [Ogataea philodendri]
MAREYAKDGVVEVDKVSDSVWVVSRVKREQELAVVESGEKRGFLRQHGDILEHGEIALSVEEVVERKSTVAATKLEICPQTPVKHK